MSNPKFPPQFVLLSCIHFMCNITGAHKNLTFPFDGALAYLNGLGVDHSHHRVALQLPCALLGHEADAASIVRTDGGWLGIVTTLCQAGQPPDGHPFNTEDLSLGAA